MLLDLFPELYERIVDEIAGDPRTLCALALSCRSLHASARRALLHTVDLDACSHSHFLRCVQRSPHLGALVRTLSIDSASSRSLIGQALRPESLSALLVLLPSLRSLSLKHLDWTIASPTAIALFGARPCTSVETLTLSKCRIDFSTSLRVFLASFANVRRLELDESGSLCAGYTTSGPQRRMAALEHLTAHGVCEGLTEVIEALPVRGLRNIQMEVWSRESLDALERACETSGARLEELDVVLGPGAEGLCRPDKMSPLNLSSNCNLKILRVRGLDLSRYWLSRHHTLWAVDVLASCTSTRLTSLEYYVTIRHSDHLAVIPWKEIDRLTRAKDDSATTDVKIFVNEHTRDHATVALVDKTMKVVFHGTGFVIAMSDI